MSTKDYIAIAKIFARVRSNIGILNSTNTAHHGTIGAVESMLIAYFQKDNSSFNYNKFREVANNVNRK